MDKDITQTEESVDKPDGKPAAKAARKNAQAEKPGVFVYIGPNIRGAIQESAIMEGKLSELKAQLADVIEQHPQVAALIVPMESLAECRRDIKTNGTLLHKKYMELLSAE